MIDRVLENIVNNLKELLDENVDVGIKYPKDCANLKGIHMFLLNVSEEATLKNSSRVIRNEGKTKYKEPSVYLNLQILIVYNSDEYITGLRYLSDTIRYFQKNKLLLINNDLGGSQIKMSVELQDITIEQLNQIWSIAGGYLYPSLLYKIRVAEIAVNEEQNAPEIVEIQMDTGIIN